jgi:hypothetical protein
MIEQVAGIKQSVDNLTKKYNRSQKTLIISFAVLFSGFIVLNMEYLIESKHVLHELILFFRNIFNK